MSNVGLKDNGNRRFVNDRREFSYTAYLPERRSGKDRRCVFDYRSIQTNESRSDLGTCEEPAGRLLNYKFLLRRACGQTLILE
jgi:hypothetical protein